MSNGYKMNNLELAEYSHGAGCGCKTSPMLLEKIGIASLYSQLFVLNTNRDFDSVMNYLQEPLSS